MGTTTTLRKTGKKLLLATSLALGVQAATAQIHIQWQKCLGGTAGEYTTAIELAQDSGYIMAGYTYSTDGDVTTAYGSLDAWITRLGSTGNIVWQKSYGGSGGDGAMSIKKTADGGYIVAGQSASTDGDVTNAHGSLDVWVWKIDGMGNLQWQKTYGGSGSEGAQDIKVTADGGYIIAAHTQSADGDVTGYHGGTGMDCWVLRLDDTGAILWQKTLGGTNDEGAVSILQTSDGGYLFGGFTMSANGDVTNYHGGTSDGGDCWVVKLDATGNKVWQKTYGGHLEEQVFELIQGLNGHYVFSAATASTDGDITSKTGAIDGWVLELNDTGGIVWQRTYGHPGGADYITSIQQQSDSGYMFTGWGMWLGQLDKNGNQLLDKTYGGTKEENGWRLRLTADGGCIVAGNTKSNDGDVSGNHGGAAGTDDIWVVKFSKPMVKVDYTNNEAFGLKAYPNPASDHVVLESSEPLTRAELYNMLGQKMSVHTMHGKGGQIDVRELPAGVYQAMIYSEAGAVQSVSISKMQ